MCGKLCAAVVYILLEMCQSLVYILLEMCPGLVILASITSTPQFVKSLPHSHHQTLT